MRTWTNTKEAQTLNYRASEDLESGRIAIHGAGEDIVGKAVDASVIYAGVVCAPCGQTVASGCRVDVQNTGVASVEIAAEVTAGQTLIADADGKAVPGNSGYIIGVATEDRGAPAVGETNYVSVRLEIHHV